MAKTSLSWEEAVRLNWVKPEDVPAAAKRTQSGKRDVEGKEQSELIKRFRELYPSVADLLIHIPNGGSRKNAFEGWRLKEQGVRAGVSDLLLTVARGGYFGLWIEFKAEPPNDAVVSESQKEWIAMMREQGYRAQVCLGAAAALKVIAEYLASPPTVATTAGG